MSAGVADSRSPRPPHPQGGDGPAQPAAPRGGAGRDAVADRPERGGQKHVAARALRDRAAVRRGAALPRRTGAGGRRGVGVPQARRDGLPGAAALRHDSLRERDRRAQAPETAAGRDRPPRDRKSRALQGRAPRRALGAHALGRRGAAREPGPGAGRRAGDPAARTSHSPRSTRRRARRCSRTSRARSARRARPPSSRRTTARRRSDSPTASPCSIAVDCGRSAPPEEVLRRPADAFVATFVGVENLLPVALSRQRAGGGFRRCSRGSGALVEERRPGRASLEIGGAAPGMRVGSAGLLCVRPEDVVVAAAGDRRRLPRPTSCRGRVAAVVPQGPFLKVTIDCGVRIVAAVSGHVARDLAIEPGRAVTVALRPAGPLRHAEGCRRSTGPRTGQGSGSSPRVPRTDVPRAARGPPSPWSGSVPRAAPA